MKNYFENHPISTDNIHPILHEVLAITPKKVGLTPDWVTEGLSTDPFFGLDE